MDEALRLTMLDRLDELWRDLGGVAWGPTRESLDELISRMEGDIRAAPAID